MLFLRQSTASQEVLLGPFVDDTDGKTAETALTIANTDIKIWVEGATTEFNKTSGGATHIASGRYYCVLDATDTATLGKMEINVHVSGALPIRREFMVLSANVFDSLVSGSDLLDISVVQLLGTAWLTPGTAGTPDVNVRLISGDSIAADNAEAFFDGTGYAGTNNVIPTVTTATNVTTVNGIAANAVTASALATDAVNEIVDAVWDEATSGHTTAGTTGKALTDATAPTAAAVADAVWDEALSGHLTAGSTGEALNAAGSAGDPWTTTLPGSYTGSQAGKMLSDILVDTGTTLQAELDGIQADTEDIQARIPAALVGGLIDASVGAMEANVLTASALATDAVSEIQSGLATPTNITAGTITTVSSVTAIATGGIVAASFGVGAINAAAIATDAIDADALAADAVTEIWAKAMTELTTVPGVTGSVLQALTWVFELSRNKVTQTATTQIVMRDDGSTTLGSSTVSDDGTTFTRGEFA